MSTSTLNNSSAESFTQAVDHFRELYGNHLPAQKSLQSDAAAVFSQLGIPTTKHEEWKYIIKHFTYSGGWKKFEPLWNFMIKTKGLNSMLPLLEAVLSKAGHNKQNNTTSISPFPAIA